MSADIDSEQQSGWITTTEGPYVSSPQALEAMRRLAAEQGLSFMHNPGGGEFYRLSPWQRCQISTCDDVADYEKLKAWVEQHPKP